MLGATAHAVPAVAYTARPASSTGRTSERSRATPAHCIVGAPEGGACEGLRRAARHVFVGGGLGGPLRCLPQISIAPAKPALEARPQSGAGDMTTAFCGWHVVLSVTSNSVNTTSPSA